VEFLFLYDFIIYSDLKLGKNNTNDNYKLFMV